MSSLGYVGRRLDLLVLHGTGPGLGDRQATMALLDGKGGAAIAGIQKLAQRVLLTLLTPRGSLRYLDEGTYFLTDARSGVWRTTLDVRQSFSAAKLDLEQQVRAAERDDDPDDERYYDLELEDVALVAEDVSLRLRLTSMAGTLYRFLVPVNVLL